MTDNVCIDMTTSETTYISRYTIDPSFLEKHNEDELFVGDIPLSGIWEGYKIKTCLKFGKMDGLTKVYDENGVLREVMILVDGKREGDFRQWDKYGHNVTMVQCVDDIVVNRSGIPQDINRFGIPQDINNTRLGISHVKNIPISCQDEVKQIIDNINNRKVLWKRSEIYMDQYEARDDVTNQLVAISPDPSWIITDGFLLLFC